MVTTCNSGTGLASFELTAEDGDGNPTTETISINVTDTNVVIVVDDDDPVVKIDDDTLTGTSTGFVTMKFHLLARILIWTTADDAVLVLYTWSTLAEDAEDDVGTTDVDESTTPVVDMVSTSPQSFMLDRERDGENDYVGSKIIAKVEYYEIDPVTNTIVKSKEFTDETDFIEAPDPGEGATASISFDFGTNDAGLGVAIVVANADPAPTSAVAVLQASENGESGWITSVRAPVTLSATGNTSTGTVSLAVNADADTDNGDGGGLYYRVVLTYGEDDEETSQTSGSIQLGDLEDPDAQETVTDIIGGEQDPEDQPGVGDTLRINTGGETAEVQWQVSNTRGGYDDIEGGDELTLKVTNDHAGKMLRAKVTYMTQEDDDETTVDESEFPTWVEYTEVLTVSGDIENNNPEATQDSYDIDVELATRPAAPATGDRDAQPAKLVMGSVADLFFDSDGDDLTYSITAVPTQ